METDTLKPIRLEELDEAEIIPLRYYVAAWMDAKGNVAFTKQGLKVTCRSTTLEPLVTFYCIFNGELASGGLTLLGKRAAEFVGFFKECSWVRREFWDLVYQCLTYNQGTEMFEELKRRIEQMKHDAKSTSQDWPHLKPWSDE